MITQCENKIMGMCGERQLQYKKTGLKFVSADVETRQEHRMHNSRTALNAKVYMEAKRNTGMLATLVNDTSREMQNLDEARGILVQTIISVKQQLKLKKRLLEENQLILAQLHQNEAAALFKMTEMGSNEPQHQQMKQLAVAALQIKAKILGRDHLFTLLSLFQIAQIDFRMNNIDQSIAAIEFIMKRLQGFGTQELHDMALAASINPISIQDDFSGF